MPELADHIPRVPQSGIRRIYEIASTLDDVISLVVGEPDVAVAPHIGEAAKAAWDRDDTNYSANGGLTPLRRAIVDKLARVNDIGVPMEQVWVTVGATQALHQAMVLTLAAGDEVLVPDPGYTTFTMNARMIDAQPVPYTLTPDRGFLPSIDELESLVTDHTRVLIINSPSNPLGVVFPESVLRELLAFARRHDLWIISDEVYEYFTYGEKHVSIAALEAEESTTSRRVFSVFSLSKTYAMTGIRVGYVVIPLGLATTMGIVQEASISCVEMPSQFVAIAAITGDQKVVTDAAEHYRENAEAATSMLDGIGIHYLPPRGTFYLWVNVSHASGGDVAAWAENFLRTERVAVAPGSAFGRSGEGWIRVSLAQHKEVLLEGLSRLPAGVRDD